MTSPNPASCPDTTSLPGAAPRRAPRVASKLMDPDDLVRLWILRLASHCLVSSGLMRASGTFRRDSPLTRGGIYGDQWSDHITDTIRALIGMSRPGKGVSVKEDQRLIRAQLQRRMRAWEKKLRNVLWQQAFHPHAAISLQAIGGLLALNETEVKCLAFILMLQSHEQLRTVANELIGELNDRKTIEAVAAVVGLPIKSVEEALSKNSRLMGSQLVRWDHNLVVLGDKFTWVSRGFAQEMLQPGFDPLCAMRDRIVPAPPPTLRWEQFAHMGELRQVALSYVRQALAQSKPGVNLLLHGDPGVGKSEFSRALAQELGCELFEVSSQDEDGDPVDGRHRLQALRVLHGFCSGRRSRSLIVFDEIEDVFPRPNPISGPQPIRIKSWVNRALENNPAVTIWISNAVSALDPAFVRRFDVVIEVKCPPTAVRVEQLRNLPVSLSEVAITKIAACAHLSPGVVHRAASVVNSIHTELPEGQAPQIMEMLINQTLQAQGHAQVKASQGAGSIYNPGYLNTDFDPVALVEGIRSAKSARLCLYGPPGTGKTAYGQWLAEQLDCPIHIKRASDLLSQFVGMAEKNIAKAFRDAAEEGAILLIDEVDSFLQERTHAHRSWEVTQVNEFLTQLEQFSGVFIATTNLMEGLDAAALRRFDLKARLDYLKPMQARGLLEAHLLALNLPKAEASELCRLDELTNLTPGDFAAVARQHRFRPLPTALAWITSLLAECRQKKGSQRQIAGFGAVAKAL